MGPFPEQRHMFGRYNPRNEEFPFLARFRYLGVCFFIADPRFLGVLSSFAERFPVVFLSVVVLAGFAAFFVICGAKTAFPLRKSPPERLKSTRKKTGGRRLKKSKKARRAKKKNFEN